MSLQPECVLSVFATQLHAFAMMLTVTCTIIAATYGIQHHGTSMSISTGTFKDQCTFQGIVQSRN